MDSETLESSPLYDKLIRDMGDVSIKFQNWWDTTSTKYGWEAKPGKKWRIDFETCNIFLE